MNRLNQWLTLLANFGVLVGIGFLAIEIRQNTDMMKAQIRDSMSEKQMLGSEWMGTNEYAADIYVRGVAGLLEPGTKEYASFSFLLAGIWREWENSHYQYERGLYESSEFEPRIGRWRYNMRSVAVRELWIQTKGTYSPAFRERLDEIVRMIEEEETDT
ncbi:MAG: hypothetical protein R3E82_23195 [Pseudomonadales bacterium]